MALIVEITPHIESSSFTIVIYSTKIYLNCNISPTHNTKNLVIDFLKIQGADKCLFTMGSEDIDTFLLRNSHKPIGERSLNNAFDRGKDEFQLSLPNARVFMKYDEALEFYQIVDRLDNEIKKLS